MAHHKKIWQKLMPILFKANSVLIFFTSAQAFCASALRCESIFSSTKDSSEVYQKLRELGQVRFAAALSIASWDGRGIPEPSLVFRGHTDPQFSLERIIRMLLGDRHYEIRSWEYSHVLNQKLNSGIRLEEAIIQSDIEIADRILAEFLKNNVSKYIQHQVKGTVVDKAPSKKYGTAIPSSMHGFGHAATYASIQLGRAVRTSAESIWMVIEIDARKAAGLPADFNEFYLFSHLPAQIINKATIRLPSGRIFVMSAQGSELSIFASDYLEQPIARFSLNGSILQSEWAENADAEKELFDAIFEKGKRRSNSESTERIQVLRPLLLLERR